ncbi:MAG TPA: hypothetical protein PLA85_07825 [Micropepsaceae bacterium]|nr:hypothetical protein [Micropepsaceae bacterium]
MSRKAWVRFFAVAALFNFAAGLPQLIDPIGNSAMLGLVVEHTPVMERIAGLLVVCFGVIYAMIATNMDRFRDLLIVAVAGKTGVFIIIGHYWLAGALPLVPMIVGTMDLLFGIGFLAFLLTVPRAAR